MKTEDHLNTEGFFHLSVTSYNIHRCVGVDGRKEPERIAEVMRECESQIVGLQEVDSPKKGSQAEYLARATGMVSIPGPAIRLAKGYYGNALLTTFPVLDSHCIDVSVAGCEPRSALNSLLEVGENRIRVLLTHLGLSIIERRRQVKRLLEILRNARETVVLMGDINEWLSLSRVLRELHSHLGKSHCPRTFPSRFPLLALDRIWVKPKETLIAIRVHKSPLSKIASDHLPVIAEIVLPRRVDMEVASP